MIFAISSSSAPPALGNSKVRVRHSHPPVILASVELETVDAFSVHRESTHQDEQVHRSPRLTCHAV
jgi:hypothetical protein